VVIDKAEAADKITLREIMDIETLLDEVMEKCRSVAPTYCEAKCPIHLDVKGYVKLIAEGKYAESLALIREKLPFPGILGRICSHPCETECQRGKVDHPVLARTLKRFVADREEIPNWDLTIKEQKKEKVAVVGSGPAGLMAAYELRKKGYQVTIIEALSHLGGMLRWGIPEYRLPRDIIDRELGIIDKLGVEVKLNTRIGESIALDDLAKDYEAVFLGIGSQISARLGLDGEDLQGIYHGIEFLRNVNMGEQVDIGNRVIVIGGGNVAVDVAHTCLKLGAKEVNLVCLECYEEMPAFKCEIEEAEKEDVKIHNSLGPKKLLRTGSTFSGVEFVRCTQVFDAEGHFNPTFDDCHTTTLEADTIVIAIGQVPDSASLVKGSQLKVNDGNYLKVAPLTLRTNLEKVFAGGDAVTGPRSVVEALAMGREAAISIDRFIRGEDLSVNRDQEELYKNPLEMEIPSGIQKLDRTSMPVLPVEDRKGNFKEMELGFSEDIALREARKCLSCECLACKKNCEFLSHHDMNPREFAEKLMQDYSTDLTVPFSCNICNLCGKMCPEGLDTGKLCHEIRKKAVNDGLAPLPQHKSVHSHQKWGTSWVFKLSKADPRNKKQASRVFFPGCTLPSYSPDLVMKTYEYLRSKLPGTDIILNCCGGPSYLIGEMDRFQEILDGLEKQMEYLGDHEIITACAKCYHILKVHRPQWKIRSLYETMVAVGLPRSLPKTSGKVFSIHDCCPARYEEKFRQAVREVMRLLGCDIEEMEFSGEKTRCCGGGGMMAPVDPVLFEKIVGLRVNETPHDLVTYCAGCRQNFASQKKPTVHLLDLVFNRTWNHDRIKPAQNGKQRWKNRWILKRQLKRL